jgi:hypothetical protein
VVAQDLMPKTVMEQWWDSDETVMEQWCLWFELFSVVLKVLRRHWSYFILLQCLGSVVIDLVVTQDLLPKTLMEQWWDSDATVMEQWCNSDAFDFSYFLLFCRFWDDIDHILSHHKLMRYVYLQRPPSSPVRGCVTPVPAYLDPLTQSLLHDHQLSTLIF